ncbi:MAG: hypothetical protein HQL21_02935 [Candidatus Omnitrophica bacterium]|nr:hypothetical protein [Candidatus Omnitrophota bacterium]
MTMLRKPALLSPRGSLMLLTLMFMTVLGVFASTFLSSVINSQRITAGQVNSKRAFYLAEAGMNKAIWYLLHTAPDNSPGAIWRTTGTTQNLDDNDLSLGTYTMTVASSGDTITITCVGTYKGTTRTVSKQITLDSFTSAPQLQLSLDSKSGGTTPDVSGNNYTATVVGNPAVVAGRIDNALRFTPGKYITLGNILQDSYDNITLSIWIKKGPPYVWADILARGVWDTQDGISINTNYTYNGVCFGHYDHSLSNHYMACDASRGVQDNKWHHIVGVMEKNGATYDYKLYIDGSLAAIETGSAWGLTATSLPWSVGARYDGSWGFSGSLDEARIYTRALSAYEVKDLYEKGLGIVGWWKLDDGSGSLAVDGSLYGNNGTLVNSPTWTNGQINGALSFNGTPGCGSSCGNYGVVTTGDVALSQNISVCAWVYPKLNEVKEIVIHGTGEVSPVAFEIYQEGLAISLRGNSWTQMSSGSLLNLNAWNFVCGTISSTTGQIYHNGLVKTTGTVALPSTSGAHVNIGAYESGAWGFNGYIDDVRIYNSALSGNEILRMYREGHPAGLRGLWYFNEGAGTSVVDNSANAYTATLVNSPSWTNGVQRGAISLNGSNQCGTVSSILSCASANKVTISSWVYPTSFAAYNSLAYTHNSNNGWWLQTLTAADTGAGYIRFGAGGQYVNSASAIPLNQWSHVMGVFSGSDYKLYINGALNNTRTQSATISDAGLVKVLGAQTSTCSSQVVSGRLDTMRIYNTALTAAHARSLYDDAALVGWWKFDEGSGTITADSSGNGHAGTLVGSPTRIAGKVGTGAVRFDGTNYIDVGNIDLSSSVYTIATWVKTSDPGQQDVYRMWFSKAEWPNSNPFELYIGSGVEGGHSNSPVFIVWNAGTGNVDIDNTSLNLRDGSWHHVAATYQNGQQRLYYDGALVASATFAGPLPSNSSSVTIGGGEYGSYHHKWIGDVDEVRLYNRVLSADEVLRLYEEGGASSSATQATFVNGSWQE